ncbi:MULTISPECIES: TonB-dependent receptor domain-containing protein [unclassified Sphingomonas]|uniref:TonB-dependent receptor domain-containing protein n=1 Tax=unclassified Sphingomonas TaxID=196159 RepID=UPI002151FC8C|nr:MULTISPECIES: TonB-dependent receptor [unclassified Sphingomonas]MCR5869461.1 TonB-dependent receptor [Sphingomonas sp. J344]UUX98809.1 TonB-dependent receptor [Sphingomonas sp. J315]
MAALHLLACASSLAIAAQTATPPAPQPSQRPVPAREADGERGREVVITGRQEATRTEADRTSYDVSKDLQVQSGTLADALRAVPGVEVDLEGRVSLRGDSGVTILIDGRPAALLRGESRGDALNSMPAGQIERVEVITNPSAAMSPEGSGGVINLVTRRTRPNARFATVRGNLGTMGRGSLSVNGAVSGKKLTLSGDAAYRRFRGEADGELDRVRIGASGAAVTTRQESESKMTMSMRATRLAADYSVDANNKLTAELAYRGGQQDVHRVDASVSQLASADFDRVADMSMKMDSLSGRAGWRRTLAGAGHELAIDFEIEQSRQRRRIDGVTDYAAASTVFEQISNEVDRTDREAKIDYKRPVGENATLNLGYQGNFSDSDNDFRGARGPSAEALTPVPALTNLFGFGQNVHAFFGTYQVNSGKFEVQVGLRAEQVELDIDQRTDAIRVARDYFKLYPTLHLGYELNAAEKLRASYSRRIQRPSAQDYNPYTIYLDPLNLRRGNPDLLPEITDSFEASWQRRKGSTFTALTGFYRTSRGGVTDIVQDLGSGVFLNTRANLATSDRVGVEAVVNTNLTKKLSVNASGTFLWNAIDPRQVGVGSRRSGTTATARASLSWQPNDKDFVQLSGNYSGRQLIAQGYRVMGGMFNIGYRRKIDDKLSVTFTGQNILDTARQETVIDTPMLRDRIRQTGVGPILFVGITRTFGSQGGRRRPEPAFEFDQNPAGPIG